MTRESVYLFIWCSMSWRIKIQHFFNSKERHFAFDSTLPLTPQEIIFWNWQEANWKCLDESTWSMLTAIFSVLHVRGILRRDASSSWYKYVSSRIYFSYLYPSFIQKYINFRSLSVDRSADILFEIRDVLPMLKSVVFQKYKISYDYSTDEVLLSKFENVCPWNEIFWVMGTVISLRIFSRNGKSGSCVLAKVYLVQNQYTIDKFPSKSVDGFEAPRGEFSYYHSSTTALNQEYLQLYRK